MTSKSWWLALETKLTTSFILLGVLSPWFSFVRNSIVMWVHCFKRVPYCITLILYLFLSIYFVAIFSHNGCCTMHFISRCFTHTNVPIYRLAILFTFFFQFLSRFLFYVNALSVIQRGTKGKTSNYKLQNYIAMVRIQWTHYSIQPITFYQRMSAAKQFFFSSLSSFLQFTWMVTKPFSFHFSPDRFITCIRLSAWME